MFPFLISMIASFRDGPDSKYTNGRSTTIEHSSKAIYFDATPCFILTQGNVLDRGTSDSFVSHISIKEACKVSCQETSQKFRWTCDSLSRTTSAQIQFRLQKLGTIPKDSLAAFSWRFIDWPSDSAYAFHEPISNKFWRFTAFNAGSPARASCRHSASDSHKFSPSSTLRSNPTEVHHVDAV